MTAPRIPEELFRRVADAIAAADCKVSNTGVVVTCYDPAGYRRMASAALEAAALAWSSETPTAEGWTGLLLEAHHAFPEFVRLESDACGQIWIRFPDGDTDEPHKLAPGALWLGPIALPSEQPRRLVPPTGNAPREGGW